jgi:hypothetical protein
MIEEAAGTRLYESKKESAQRTIEKKDMKLQEIDRVSGNRANTTCNTKEFHRIIFASSDLERRYHTNFDKAQR